MPSPFPGMDPWLEAPWIYADLRFCFVVRFSMALNAMLPPEYCSRLRHIIEEGQCFKDGESYLEVVRICEPRNQRLLAIEIPERHPRWRDCRAVGEWPSGRITIRLFRDPWNLRNGLPAASEVVTRRSGEAEYVELTTIDYTFRLPTLNVAYHPELPSLQVPLQPILDHIYDTGLYPRQVDYRQPCHPPLTPEQQAWAAGVLAAKGA